MVHMIHLPLPKQIYCTNCTVRQARERDRKRFLNAKSAIMMVASSLSLSFLSNKIVFEAF